MKDKGWPVKPKVYEVEWDDNAGGHGWTKPHNYASDPCSKCMSVGYLLSEDSKTIKLVQSMDRSFGNVDASIIILKSCITKRRRVA